MVNARIVLITNPEIIITEDIISILFGPGLVSTCSFSPLVRPEILRKFQFFSK